MTQAKPARVYFNLHKKVWSVQGYIKGRGWIVLFHCPELWLENVTFKVSEAGRQRVIRSRRKNVHAFIRGIWNDDNPAVSDLLYGGVTYNQYQNDTFVTRDSGTAVRKAYVAIGTIRDGRAQLFACGWS